MMKSKDLTHLIHQASGFWNIFPYRITHIIISLYMAPFSLKYLDMAPVRVHIIEKYDAWVGALSNCYVSKTEKIGYGKH